MDGRKRSNMTKMNSYESAKEDAKVLAAVGIILATEVLKYIFYGILAGGSIILLFGIISSFG